MDSKLKACDAAEDGKRCADLCEVDPNIANQVIPKVCRNPTSACGNRDKALITAKSSGH